MEKMTNLAALLEAECEGALADVNAAEAGSEEAKDAMYRLQKYHEMLNNERKYILETRKQDDESRLKGKELDLKTIVQENERGLKSRELDMKQSAQLDDNYNRNRELTLREADQELKNLQNQDSKTDRMIGHVLTGAGILIPFVGSWIWMGRSMKFEETGSFTSRAGQWISNHMRLFKGKNG